MTKKPVHQVKMGAVRGAVWANESKQGTFYSVTFSRVYKKEDEWKDSQSFHAQHLPLLVKVADALHTFLYENPKEDGEDVIEGGEE